MIEVLNVSFYISLCDFADNNIISADLYARLNQSIEIQLVISA